MPSNTITDWYTFNNWGPLTTTFTAPASCATVTDDYRLATKTDPLLYQYLVQCSTIGYYDCIPTGSASRPNTQPADPTAVYQQSYYSPGLHCPSGWETVGVASRDGDNTLAFSGVLIPTSSSSNSNFPKWQEPLMLLPELLDPSETLALCCPSSMTAHMVYGCYSTVPDFETTEGCAQNYGTEPVGTSTKTRTVNGTTSTDLLWVITASNPLVVSTYPINNSATDKPIAVSVLPMLPLVHHQSDFQSTETAGTASTTVGPTAATSASNSAARAISNPNSWNELSGVLGVSLAAIVLGAAIVFQ